MTARTAPWSLDAEQAAQGSFTMAGYVVIRNDSGLSERLDLVAGRVDFNGRRAPRVLADITASWPSRTTRAQLDPRAGLSLRIYAGYKWGGYHSDIHQLTELRVLEVDLDHVAKTVSFTCASDESLIIDYPVSSTSTAYTATDFVAERIQYWINLRLSTTPAWTIGKGVPTGVVFPDSQAYEYGDDWWDIVKDWADTLGATIYSVTKDEWHLVKQPTAPNSNPAARLKVGAHGTVSALNVIRSCRDDWCNRLTLVYENRGGNGASADKTTLTIARANSTLTPVRIQVIRKTKAKPVQPQQAALHALRRALKRGYRATLTATAYLWLRPDQTITVQHDDGQERLLVESVIFDLTRGTMQVAGNNPRDYVSSTITTPDVRVVTPT